jgi:hypothetical protein
MELKSKNKHNEVTALKIKSVLSFSQRCKVGIVVFFLFGEERTWKFLTHFYRASTSDSTAITV